MRFKSIREERGYSEQDIANVLGVTANTYRKYENQPNIMRINKLYILSRFYDVSIDYLMGRSENPKK